VEQAHDVGVWRGDEREAEGEGDEREAEGEGMKERQREKGKQKQTQKQKQKGRSSCWRRLGEGEREAVSGRKGKGKMGRER
jgi:hypothetical protein